MTGVGDGDGGGGGATGACDNGSDHDDDLLSNSLELAIGTDPCLADTDNDQHDGRLGVLVGART